MGKRGRSGPGLLLTHSRWLGFALSLALFLAPLKEPMDEQYLRYLGATQVVLSGVRAFSAYENKLPQTFAGLADSPYLAVRPEDLMNPYFGRQMKVTEKPELGDIGWENRDGRLRIIFRFRRRAALPDEESASEFTADDARNWVVSAQQKQFGHDPYDYVKNLSREDKYLYLACYQVSLVFRNAHVNPYIGSLPGRYEGLNENLRYRQFFVYSIYNPYQKRVAREVRAPTPGDLQLRQIETPYGHIPVLYCFNGKGEAISPSLAAVFAGAKPPARPVIAEPD